MTGPRGITWCGSPSANAKTRLTKRSADWQDCATDRLRRPIWTNAIHDPPTQPLGSGVEDLLARPIDQKLRYRRRRLEGDLETHPRPVLGFALQRVLDMLGVLPQSLVGVPHHPVRAPVVFEHLGVDDAGDLDGDLHMMGASVGIAVDDLGTLVHRGPGRRRADVGQRLQDRFWRRIDDNLSRCLDGPYQQ